MNPREYLSKDEILGLHALSDSQGWRAIAFDWAVIAAAFALATRFPHPLTIALSLVLLGGRQLGLAILVHECAHGTLFESARLNRFVGRWLCGPLWLDLDRYRAHHLRHHRLAGTTEDPDYSLVAPYPTTRGSLARKLARDLLGLTGLKRILALAMMDAGFLEFTVAADSRPTGQPVWPVSRWLPVAIRNLSPTLLTHGMLFAILKACGAGWTYALWWVAYLTTYSLFVRIRSIAEHASTRMGTDPLDCTRTTLASPLARLTVAPHHVNFHLEHHLLMSVPCFRLPDLHRRLAASRAYERAFLARSYRENLRSAIRSASS